MTFPRVIGFDARFVAAQSIALLTAPFFAVLLTMLFGTGPNGERYELANLSMIVLIAGTYGVAEAILSMPYSVFYGLAGWLSVHAGLKAIGTPDPWPARLGIVASAVGYCLGQGLHWQSQNLAVSDRLWEVIIGVIPATVLAAAVVYRSDRADDTEETAS